MAKKDVILTAGRNLSCQQKTLKSNHPPINQRAKRRRPMNRGEWMKNIILRIR